MIEQVVETLRCVSNSPIFPNFIFWCCVHAFSPAVSYMHPFLGQMETFSFSFYQLLQRNIFSPVPPPSVSPKCLLPVSPTSASSQCQLPVLTPSRVKWSTRHHQLQYEQHNRSVLLLLHCSYVFSPSLLNPEGLEGLSAAWRHASHSHQGMLNIVDIPGMF